MKLKLIIVLCMTALLTCSCGATASAAEAPAPISLGDVISAVTVVLDVDGKTITVDNAAGCTLDAIFTMANVTLNEGDIVSVDTEDDISTQLNVHILRRCEITVTETMGDGTELKHSAVLFGGTVQDALDALELTVDAEDAVMNYAPFVSLTDGMDITIVLPQEEIAEPEEAENEEAEDAAQPAAEVPYSPNTSYAGSSTGNSAASSAGSSTDSSSETQEQTPARTVIDVQDYEDCDGSGHGVKVITYSDGSQEEVLY